MKSPVVWVLFGSCSGWWRIVVVLVWLHMHGKSVVMVDRSVRFPNGLHELRGSLFPRSSGCTLFRQDLLPLLLRSLRCGTTSKMRKSRKSKNNTHVHVVRTFRAAFSSSSSSCRHPLISLSDMSLSLNSGLSSSSPFGIHAL